jgi:hypothetical protein
MFTKLTKLAHFVSVLLVLISILNCLDNPILCISRNIKIKRNNKPRRIRRARADEDQDAKKKKADEDSRQKKAAQDELDRRKKKADEELERRAEEAKKELEQRRADFAKEVLDRTAEAEKELEKRSAEAKKELDTRNEEAEKEEKLRDEAADAEEKLRDQAAEAEKARQLIDPSEEGAEKARQAEEARRDAAEKAEQDRRDAAEKAEQDRQTKTDEADAKRQAEVEKAEATRRAEVEKAHAARRAAAQIIEQGKRDAFDKYEKEEREKLKKEEDAKRAEVEKARLEAREKLINDSIAKFEAQGSNSKQIQLIKGDYEKESVEYDKKLKKERAKLHKEFEKKQLQLENEITAKKAGLELETIEDRTTLDLEIKETNDALEKQFEENRSKLGIKITADKAENKQKIDNRRKAAQTQRDAIAKARDDARKSGKTVEEAEKAKQDEQGNKNQDEADNDAKNLTDVTKSVKLTQPTGTQGSGMEKDADNDAKNLTDATKSVKLTQQGTQGSGIESQADNDAKNLTDITKLVKLTQTVDTQGSRIESEADNDAKNVSERAKLLNLTQQGTQGSPIESQADNDAKNVAERAKLLKLTQPTDTQGSRIESEADEDVRNVAERAKLLKLTQPVDTQGSRMESQADNDAKNLTDVTKSVKLTERGTQGSRIESQADNDAKNLTDVTKSVKLTERGTQGSRIESQADNDAKNLTDITKSVNLTQTVDTQDSRIESQADNDAKNLAEQAKLLKLTQPVDTQGSRMESQADNDAKNVAEQAKLLKLTQPTGTQGSRMVNQADNDAKNVAERAKLLKLTQPTDTQGSRIESEADEDAKNLTEITKSVNLTQPGTQDSRMESLADNEAKNVAERTKSVTLAQPVDTQRTGEINSKVASEFNKNVDAEAEYALKFIERTLSTTSTFEEDTDSKAADVDRIVAKHGVKIVHMQEFVNSASEVSRFMTGIRGAFDSINMQCFKGAQRIAFGYSGHLNINGDPPNPDPDINQQRLNIYKLNCVNIVNGKLTVDKDALKDSDFTKPKPGSVSTSFLDKFRRGVQGDAVRVKGTGQNFKDWWEQNKMTKRTIAFKDLFEIIEIDGRTLKWEKYETDVTGKTTRLQLFGQLRFNITKWSNLAADIIGIATMALEFDEFAKTNSPEDTAAHVAKEFAVIAAMNAGTPIGLGILYTIATPFYLLTRFLRNGVRTLFRQAALPAAEYVTFKGVTQGVSKGIVKLGGFSARFLYSRIAPQVAARAIAAGGLAVAGSTAGATAGVTAGATAGAASTGWIATAVIPGVNLLVAAGMLFYTIWEVVQDVKDKEKEERDRKEAEKEFLEEAKAIQEQSIDTILANTDEMELTISTSLADTLFLILQRKARVPEYQITSGGQVTSGLADPAFIMHNYVGVYNVKDNVYDFYYWKQLSSTDFIKIANGDNATGTYAYSTNVQNEITYYLYENAYWSNSVMDANSKFSETDPKHNSLIPTREQYYRILNMQNTYGSDINIQMVKYYRDEEDNWNSIVFSPVNKDKYYYFPTNYDLISNLSKITPRYIGPPNFEKTIVNGEEVTTITDTPTNSPTFNYPYYFESVDIQLQLVPLFDIFYQNFIILSGMPVLSTTNPGGCFDFTKVNNSRVYTWSSKPGLKDPLTNHAIPITTQTFNTYIWPDTKYKINGVYPSSNLQNPYVLLSMAINVIKKLPAIDTDTLGIVDNLFLPIFIDFCNNAYNILRPINEIGVQSMYGLFITHVVDKTRDNDFAVLLNGNLNNIVNKKYVVKTHLFSNQSEYNKLFNFIDKFYKNMINDTRISPYHYPISIDTLLNYSYMFYFLGFHNTFVPSSILNTPINSASDVPQNNGLNKQSTSYNNYKQRPLFTTRTIKGSMVDENSMIRNLNEVDTIYNLIYGVVTDINLQNSKGEDDLGSIKAKYLWKSGITEEDLKNSKNYINVLYGLNRNNESKTYIPAYYIPKTTSKTVKGETIQIYNINNNTTNQPGGPIYNTVYTGSGNRNYYFYPFKPEAICGVPVYDSIINTADPKISKIKPPGSSTGYANSINYTTSNSMALNNLLLRSWWIETGAVSDVRTSADTAIGTYTNGSTFPQMDWVKGAENINNIMNVSTILNVMQLYATVLTSMLYNDTGFAMNVFGFFYNMGDYYLDIFDRNKADATYNYYNKYTDLWFAAVLGYNIPFTPSTPILTNTNANTLAVSTLETRNFSLFKSNATSLYFTMSGTSFQSNTYLKILTNSQADLDLMNGYLRGTSTSFDPLTAVDFYYTGTEYSSIEYFTSIAIKIPSCIGFSVKTDNSVVFYQLTSFDATLTLTADSGVIFSCLSLFPSYYDINIFSVDTTGNGISTNKTFVRYLLGIVRDIKPNYLPPNILFEKRIGYRILQNSGTYIKTDTTRVNFINPLDSGLNSMYPGINLQSEVQQIVRFFNHYMSDPYSDYRDTTGYLERKPNTELTREEINAYSRMAYINSFLLFYVYYFRKPDTKIQSYALDYSSYNNPGDVIKISKYYEEETIDGKIIQKIPITAQNLIDKLGRCVVNYNYYFKQQEKSNIVIFVNIGTINTYTINLVGNTSLNIPNFTADTIIVEFFNYFVNIDYYENIVGNIEKAYPGNGSNDQGGEKEKGRIVSLSKGYNNLKSQQMVDLKSAPPQNFEYFYYQDNIKEYFNKTDFGPHFNYSKGPTKNYPALGLNNCYVNFSQYITTFSVNQTDSSIMFYKGQLRITTDSSVVNNNIYLIGAGQNLQQNQQNNIFTNMYTRIFNNNMNILKTTCKSEYMHIKDDAYVFFPSATTLGSTINWTSNGGFIYTQMPVNIHIYNIDDPYYNYMSNPLYTKIDFANTLVDPYCEIPTNQLLNGQATDLTGVSPLTVINNFKVEEDAYNILYCQYIADNTQNIAGGKFCTGFLYDPVSPKSVKFYSISANTPSPLTSRVATYNDEKIPINTIPFSPMQLIPSDGLSPSTATFYDRGYNIYGYLDNSTFYSLCGYMPGNFYPTMIKPGQVFTYNPNSITNVSYVTEIKSGNPDGLFEKYVTSNRRDTNFRTALLGITVSTSIVVILVYKDGTYATRIDPSIGRLPSLPANYIGYNTSYPKMGSNVNDNPEVVTADFNNVVPVELIQLHTGIYGVVFLHVASGATRFVQLTSILNGKGTYKNPLINPVKGACLHPYRNILYFTSSLSSSTNEEGVGGILQANMLYIYDYVNLTLVQIWLNHIWEQRCRTGLAEPWIDITYSDIFPRANTTIVLFFNKDKLYGIFPTSSKTHNPTYPNTYPTSPEQNYKNPKQNYLLKLPEQGGSLVWPSSSESSSLSSFAAVVSSKRPIPITDLTFLQTPYEIIDINYKSGITSNNVQSVINTTDTKFRDIITNPDSLISIANLLQYSGEDDLIVQNDLKLNPGERIDTDTAKSVNPVIRQGLDNVYDITVNVSGNNPFGRTISISVQYAFNFTLTAVSGATFPTTFSITSYVADQTATINGSTFTGYTFSSTGTDVNKYNQSAISVWNVFEPVGQLTWVITPINTGNEVDTYIFTINLGRTSPDLTGVTIAKRSSNLDGAIITLKGGLDTIIERISGTGTLTTSATSIQDSRMESQADDGVKTFTDTINLISSTGIQDSRMESQADDGVHTLTDTINSDNFRVPLGIELSNPTFPGSFDPDELPTTYITDPDGNTYSVDPDGNMTLLDPNELPIMIYPSGALRVVAEIDAQQAVKNLTDTAKSVNLISPTGTQDSRIVNQADNDAKNVAERAKLLNLMSPTGTQDSRIVNQADDDSKNVAERAKLLNLTQPTGTQDSRVVNQADNDAKNVTNDAKLVNLIPRSTSSAGSSTSSGGSSTSSAGSSTSSGEKPTSSGEKPTSPGGSSTSSAGSSTSSGEKPTSSGEKPTSPGEKPTSSVEKPTSSDPNTPVDPATVAGAAVGGIGLGLGTLGIFGGLGGPAAPPTTPPAKVPNKWNPYAVAAAAALGLGTVALLATIRPCEPGDDKRRDTEEEIIKSGIISSSGSWGRLFKGPPGGVLEFDYTSDPFLPTVIQPTATSSGRARSLIQLLVLTDGYVIGLEGEDHRHYEIPYGQIVSDLNSLLTTYGSIVIANDKTYDASILNYNFTQTAQPINDPNNSKNNVYASNPSLRFDSTVSFIPDNVNFDPSEENLLLDLQYSYVNLNKNILSGGNKTTVNLSYGVAVQQWLNAYKLVLQLITCKTAMSSILTPSEVSKTVFIDDGYITKINKYVCKGLPNTSNYYNLLNLYPSITNISVIWRNTSLRDRKWEPISNLDAADSRDSNKKLFFTQIINVNTYYYGINYSDNEIYYTTNLSKNSWTYSGGNSKLPVNLTDSKNFKVVSMCYNPDLGVFSMVLSDANIWSTSYVPGGLITNSIEWTKYTTSGDYIFITYFNNTYYYIKNDNNIYQDMVKVNNLSDFIFLGYADNMYIKIDTYGSIYTSPDIVTWTITPSYGFTFSNIIPIPTGYLAIGTRPANEISSKIMIEANDQVSAKNFGEKILEKSAILLHDGTILPDNIEESIQRKYFYDSIESSDFNASIKLGSKINLSINDYFDIFIFQNF